MYLVQTMFRAQRIRRITHCKGPSCKIRRQKNRDERPPKSFRFLRVATLITLENRCGVL